MAHPRAMAAFTLSLPLRTPCAGACVRRTHASRIARVTPRTRLRHVPMRCTADTPRAPEQGAPKAADGITYPTLLPTLVVENGEAGISYYTSALGASVTRIERSDGRILHSLLETSYGVRISVVDYFPGAHFVEPLAPGGLVEGVFQYVTVPKGECEKAVGRMVGAGATVVQEPVDAFYGQRIAKVVDRYGVAWIFASDL